MIVRTKFAALIPAIERAGHTAILEPVEETVRDLNAEPSIRERVAASTSSLAIPSLPNLRPSADIDPHRCGPGYCDGGGPRACTRRPRASTTCPNFSYVRPE